MAVVVGTNAGFVTVAPTSDPTGSNSNIHGYAFAVKDTSDATAVKVIEMGWYNNNSTASRNTEVGIYTHNAGTGRPLDKVGSVEFTKTSGAGWKSVACDIAISPNTIYWCCAQCDSGTTTAVDYTFAGANTGNAVPAATTLPDPWSAAGNTNANYAVYAVWEVASALNPKVKVAGAFATKKTLVKIGGNFAEKPVLVKVSGTFQ